MDSPATIVKSAINPSTIIKGIVGFVIIAAIFDALGLTTWLLYPFSSAKSKFARGATPQV